MSAVEKQFLDEVENKKRLLTCVSHFGFPQADLMVAQQLQPTNHSIIAELKACRGEMAMYKEREQRACQRYFSSLNDATNGGQAQSSQNNGQQPEAMLN